MNLHTSAQHQGFVAWTSLASPVNPAIDLRHHANFSFTFRVDTDILVDAVFNIRSNGPDPANPCNVGPVGEYSDIPEVVTCAGPWGVTPDTKSQVIIPAGTKDGAVCTATLPCKPDAFVRVFPVSGDTGKIEVVATLSGPR